MSAERSWSDDSIGRDDAELNPADRSASVGDNVPGADTTDSQSSEALSDTEEATWAKLREAIERNPPHSPLLALEGRQDMLSRQLNDMFSEPREPSIRKQNLAELHETELEIRKYMRVVLVDMRSSDIPQETYLDSAANLICELTELRRDRLNRDIGNHLDERLEMLDIDQIKKYISSIAEGSDDSDLPLNLARLFEDMLSSDISVAKSELELVYNLHDLALIHDDVKRLNDDVKEMKDGVNQMKQMLGRLAKLLERLDHQESKQSALEEARKALGDI